MSYRPIYQFKSLGIYRIEDRNDTDLITTANENDNNYDQFIKCQGPNCLESYNALKFEISSSASDQETLKIQW